MFVCACMCVCGVAGREGVGWMGGATQSNKETELTTGGQRPTEKSAQGGYLLIPFIKCHSQHGTLYWLFHKWRGDCVCTHNACMSVYAIGVCMCERMCMHECAVSVWACMHVCTSMCVHVCACVWHVCMFAKIQQQIISTIQFADKMSEISK